MKICFIADSKSPHTEKWVKHFVKLGHEVSIITWNDNKIENCEHFYLKDVYKISIRRFWITFRNILNVKGLLKKINPDVVHVHYVTIGGFYCWILRQKQKTVISAWGSDILVFPQISYFHKMFLKKILRESNYITSDSEYMTQKIIELRQKDMNIYTFPMGVEEKLFESKHEYILNDKRLNIVSVRLHSSNYNIDIIIKGFYEALKLNENMKLTIGGTGNETVKLKRLVEDLDIKDKVEFIGWYNAEDVGGILEENDVFISIPKSDATSVSLLEAMGVGIFPIVSNIPANNEWIRNNENGLVINPTIEDVKDAIIWCLENKKNMKTASDINRDLIRKKATWEENVKIVEELYENIINKK